MARPTVAFLCTPERGHFARLRALIAHVVAAGARALVFTHPRFRSEVEAAGGDFLDLYGRYPIERADASSHPVSCRHVTYAGHFGETVTAELRAVKPDLIVYDSFAVVAVVAARLLDVPRVCVCAGHDLQPERTMAELALDPRVRDTRRCEEAVEVLRRRYGLTDATPFSFVSTLSPDLNVYCEPPEYLPAESRAVFEPVAFFGSLPTLEPPPPGPSPFGDRANGVRRVYVSFGTVVWRYYAREGERALRAITAALARRRDCRVLVSLGAAVRLEGLDAPNVRVEDYVDQWRVLHEADLFFTHQGLNSTHEAAWTRVPMVSYPFFWDQPGLAARCAEFGLSVPLGPGRRPPITEADVEAACDAVDARLPQMRVRLDAARSWEARVTEGRAEVTARVLGLA